MKLGAISSIVVATPLALGAGGVVLTRENRAGRINDALQKASLEVRRNEDQVELLKRLKLPNVVPVKRIDYEETKKGMAFHMLERKRINGCSYKIKVGNQEHDLSKIFEADKVMSNPAGRAFLELSVTKDWRKWGEGIIDAACFKSKNITVERHLSPTWKGWHYWWVIAKDERGKEVYKDWFWQK